MLILCIKLSKYVSTASTITTTIIAAFTIVANNNSNNNYNNNNNNNDSVDDNDRTATIKTKMKHIKAELFKFPCLKCSQQALHLYLTERKLTRGWSNVGEFFT